MNTPVSGDTAGERAVLIVCLQSLFVHDARDYGNAPSGHAVGLIGISPPPGSLRGALLCCDGSPFSRQREKARGRSALGLDASIIIAPYRSLPDVPWYVKELGIAGLTAEGL